MKNAVISIILFFVLIIGIFFFNNFVINLYDSIQSKTDEIEVILLNQDYSTAYDSC